MPGHCCRGPKVVEEEEDDGGDVGEYTAPVEMSFVYQKLPESRRSRGLRARAWLIVKRAAVRVVGLYVRRRGWAARQARRVTWVGIWAKVRGAVGLPRVSSGRVAAAYDSGSYAMNFDDGVWKAEDAEFWRSRSFASRFGSSSSSSSAAARFVA